MPRARSGVLPPRLPYLAVGAGPPLVFLGGITPERPRPAWLGRAQLLGALRPYTADYTVYALSWQVRPEVPAPGMADIAADHATAIEAAFDGPVPVVGVSTGASVALQLAADHPEAVTRLVVVCGACRLSPAGHDGQRRALQLARAGRHRAAWRALDAAVTAAGPTRWALDAAALTAGPLTPGLLALLQAEEGFDLADRLGEVTAPTLVAGGERDRPYGRELMERTAHGIPGARLVVATGRGHLGAVTDRRLVGEVRSFLRAGDRSAA